MTLSILLSGATGAVGRLLAEEIRCGDRFRLAGSASSEQFFEPDAEADAIVDFSHPALLQRVVAFAHRRRLPLVIGTTGLPDELQDEIHQAARDIPVCQSANFSLGVNLMIRIAGELAAQLDDDFDLEVSEMHHRRKLDAPSGTALALGAALAQARGLDQKESAVFDRSRDRIPRSRREIGYQTIRGGDVAGEHTVYFLGEGERLELTHRATDRAIFARGALRAARQLVGHPAGVVDFIDLVAGR
jgi:4-hydroxy-tetrahydrodipicolinate reductase